jgi:hypothetical protein
MAKGFKHGGGSLPLNFKVICNPRPETAKENTIWVDTDRINNYYFCATQPENMAEYDVWFPVGTSSTVAFNALKKNGIQVYPLSAKQYISGACVDKIAETYQNGVWVEWWYGQIFANGHVYTKSTGGIKGYAYKSATGQGSVVSPTLSINDEAVTFTVTGSSSAGTLFVENPIDLTNFDKLTINLTARTGPSATIHMGITKTKQNSFSWVAYSEISKTGTVELDVSNIEGEHYCVIALSSSGTKSVTFDEWRLE